MIIFQNNNNDTNINDNISKNNNDTNPLTAVDPLGTMFSKPHYYFGIGPFFNPVNYFDYKKVKLFFSEEILIF